MNLVIFGATGTVGRELVTQALGAGHTVTAFTRGSGGPLKDLAGLQIFQGDVLDRDAVTAAVRGADAVLVTLGAGLKGGLRAPGTANIVAAMRATGVRRLICQSTLGAGDSWANLNFYWKRIMFGLLLRAAYRDHQRQEEIVRASGLDWTIVRPAAFTDGPRTAAYKHGFPATLRDLTLKISRADVADFLVRQVSDRSYLGKTPGLSY